MKKLLALAVFVGMSSWAHATTITAPSSLIGANALEGDDAYSWGISIAVPTGQTITSASIDFSDITLTASGNSQGTGVLYTDILNDKNTGLTTAVDNDAPGDYWATQYSGKNITVIGTNYFASVGTTISDIYNFNSTQLAALNSYLTAGTFNIGIDPDCHFSVGDITFNYTLGSTTSNTAVPDVAASALLLLLSLGGLEVCRRQFAVAAKVKA